MLTKRGWSLLALACVVAVAAGIGVAWLRRSPSRPAVGASATRTVPVPRARPGVPVPVRGYYWGGVNGRDSSTVPGCPFPNSYSGQGSNYGGLECKINWAAGQLRLATHAATAGRFHTSMVRAYLSGELACRDQQARLKPGGDIFGLASQPGRRLLILSTRCGPWKHLAGGRGRAAEDGYLREDVKLIRRLPVPVIFVFHHEPEDEACDPKSGMGTPDDFRRAFRQFAADVRDEAGRDGPSRISTGWILQDATFSTGGRGDREPFSVCNGTTVKNTSTNNPLRNPENWYPGDDAVDWIGADIYTHGIKRSLRSAVVPFVKWASGPCPTAHPRLDWTCTTARGRRPLFLGEFGPGLAKSSAPTQAQKAAWFTQLRADLNNPSVHDFDRIKAFAYWSSGQQNVVDMPFDPTHPALRAYTALSLDPRAVNPVLVPDSG